MLSTAANNVNVCAPGSIASAAQVARSHTLAQLVMLYTAKYAAAEQGAPVSVLSADKVARSHTLTLWSSLQVANLTSVGATATALHASW